MWSDPDDVETWAVSPRGAGWLFGGSVTREVRLVLSTLLIFTSHIHISYLIFYYSLPLS
jgi:serine/threonine-protein phosphatase 6 catalytic subunit